jgi:hypothetical protein
MNHSALNDARDTLMLARKAARERVRWSSLMPCEISSRHAFVPTRLCVSA